MMTPEQQNMFAAALMENTAPLLGIVADPPAPPAPITWDDVLAMHQALSVPQPRERYVAGPDGSLVVFDARLLDMP